MKGRKPTTEEKRHMNKVAEIGCIVCLLHHSAYSPAEIHHTEGKTKEGAHFKVLPLCFKHHNERASNDLYVSRHPYKAEFEKRYGTEQYLLSKTNELLRGE